MGSGKLEVGSGKLEVGSGKWEVGSWKWEVGSGKWEVGSGKLEVGSWKWEVGSGKLEVGSGKLEETGNGNLLVNYYFLDLAAAVAEIDFNEIYSCPIVPQVHNCMLGIQSKFGSNTSSQAIGDIISDY